SDAVRVGVPSTSVRWQPTPREGVACAIVMASSVAGAFAKMLTLVSTPSRCASSMPALTPGVSPKSSPLMTSRRVALATLFRISVSLDRHAAADVILTRRHAPRANLVQRALVFVIRVRVLRQHPGLRGVRRRQPIRREGDRPDVRAPLAFEI